MINRGIYPYDVGGIEIHSSSISNELSGIFQVAILFESNVEKISNHSWIPIRIRRQKNPFLYLISGFLAILKSKIKPQITISHSGFSPMILGLCISKIFRIPHIMVNHGSDIRTVGRRTWLKYLHS